MRVSDVMTADVQACGPADDASAAARIMWERDCGAVPVVLEDRRVIGMITDRDIAMAAYTRGLCLHEIPVETVMSVGATTCTADETIEDCEQRMAAARVRRLPVLDASRRLCGIVSLSDLARAKACGDRQAEAEVSRTLAAIGEPRRARALRA